MCLIPEQCRAARGLLNWSQEHLANLSGVSRSTIKDFECHRHALQRNSAELLILAFKTAGVEFFVEEDSVAGLRLRRGGESQGG
jgi:transcriptional regulator with XRE-family HTH domain